MCAFWEHYIDFPEIGISGKFESISGKLAVIALMSPWPSVITLNIFYRFYALHGEYKSFFQHSIIESATSTVGIELASSVWAILGDLGLRSFINRRDAPQTILGHAQGLYDAYTISRVP